jgi:hypothetical protein
MAINIQTATVEELRTERKELNDRIKAGGLGPGQLETARRNLAAVKNRLSALGQAVTDTADSVDTTGFETVTWYDPETDNMVIGDPRLGPNQVPPGATVMTPTGPQGPTGATGATGQTGAPIIPTLPTGPVVNPNDVNNNGIPDNIEAAQLQIAAGERAAAEQRRLFLEDAAANKKTAIDVLRESIKVYFTQSGDESFVAELSSIIDDYAKQGYDASTISVLLPQTAPYQTRFSGNKGRLAAGLSALSAKDYIDAENDYNEILTRFNLRDLAKRDTFSNLISGQVSAAELTDRVVNVYDRIRNADPALRAEMDRVEALSRGQLSDADFAKALLTGETGANELKRKISTAEISAEARQRNLSVQRAEQLQQLGVDRQQARAGFETIAQAQPTFEKLAGIYDREVLGAEESQTELEQEVFQGMQSQRRKRLVEQEAASFSGASGLSGSALSTQRAGQI